MWVRQTSYSRCPRRVQERKQRYPDPTPTLVGPEKVKNNVIVASIGDELLMDLYDTTFANHGVYFGTDGRINEGM